MRRILLPILFVGLTGVLVAQTPQTMPLTVPNKFDSKVTFQSQQQDGDKFTLKGVRVEFALGVTITADEMTFDKREATPAGDTMKLSGNVQMYLKKK